MFPNVTKLNLVPAAPGIFLLAIGLMATLAFAQRAPGVPSSVTSQNFGGHVDRAPGIPASVTGYGTVGVHNSGAFNSRTGQGRGGDRDGGNRNRNHDGYDRNRGGYIYGFAPYYYGGYDNYGQAPEGSDGYAQEQYNGGPTVFDRRGDGNYSAPPSDYAPRENHEEQMMASASQPEPAPSNQPETVLVFKDGRHVEVQNYAIVGNTLYDFSEGGRKKIAMAELDIPATAKQNDERGVDFTVPATGKAK